MYAANGLDLYVNMENVLEQYSDYFYISNSSDPTGLGDTCCFGGEGQVCDHKDAMRFDAVYIPVLYSLALVVGLLGNGLLLWVLVHKRQSWSVTDTFILHLGVADCLLLVTLPFWAAQAAQEEGWSFGTPLCKITGAVFTINFYCGIFLLACISLDRYLSIVHATQMYSRRKAWVIQANCLAVWILSLILSIPDWVFLKAEWDSRQKRTECIHDYMSLELSMENWRLASRLLYHVVGFLLPSAVLVFCYTCILLRLHRGSQGVKKQRAVRVIVALVVVFFLCWTPYNIALVVDTLYANKTLSDTCETRTGLDKAIVVTSSLGYVHCSLNPVLYAFVGVKFRRQLLDVVRSLGCKVKSRARLTSKASSRRESLWSESGGDTSHSVI